MGILKKINTTITVIGLVTSTYEIMQKTFKWYNKKYSKKEKKEISKPIIKGA